MVFKKNLVLKVFILLKFFLLLSGCAYKYSNEDNSDTEDIKKIKLNVKSYEINKDSLDVITTENLLQNEINKKVLNKLEAWAWQKFVIEGNENKASLNLLKIDTSLIEKSKNKKSILSIIHQGQEVYKISLHFDICINASNSLIKTLKVSSSLDFELLNKYSISQRNKVIIYNVNKLIKLIDERITSHLLKKDFKKFVIM